jgi:hypothetical protein
VLWAMLDCKPNAGAELRFDRTGAVSVFLNSLNFSNSLNSSS